MNAAVTRSVRRHSVGWLVAANAVGLLLAVLLLRPGLNDLLAPLTYGRWMPLHLNWQLYGWCALPLVGVLFRFYLPDDDRAASAARFALGCWTATLFFGGLTWLAGQVGGKAFLDWTGAARSLWALAGLILWLVLMRQAARRNPLPAAWAWALLIALGAVPFVLYWAAGPGVYPAVNPDSGGPTGASLLGSTLGVIAIFAARLASGERPLIYGDGSQTRDFIFVGDVVSFILDAIHHEGPLAGPMPDGPAFNVATGQRTSVQQVAAYLSAQTGVLKQPEFLPAREGDIPHSALDPAKAERALGWAACQPIENGLAFTWRWLKANLA